MHNMFCNKLNWNSHAETLISIKTKLYGAMFIGLLGRVLLEFTDFFYHTFILGDPSNPLMLCARIVIFGIISLFLTGMFGLLIRLLLYMSRKTDKQERENIISENPTLSAEEVNKKLESTENFSRNVVEVMVNAICALCIVSIF